MIGDFPVLRSLLGSFPFNRQQIYIWSVFQFLIFCPENARISTSTSVSANRILSWLNQASGLSKVLIIDLLKLLTANSNACSWVEGTSKPVNYEISSDKTLQKDRSWPWLHLCIFALWAHVKPGYWSCWRIPGKCSAPTLPSLTQL